MNVNNDATTDRRALAVLSLGHLCIDLCQAVLPAVLPVLFVERHLSYTSAGGLILASTIASSVIQPLFGHLTDRSPAPWLMPVGLLMAGGGLTLACLAPNYWLIALAAAFAGIGVAAFHPEAARLVNAAAGKRRATSMSLFSVGGNLGFALGPAIVSAILLVWGLNGMGVLLVPLALVAVTLMSLLNHFLSYRKGHGWQGSLEAASRPDAWKPFVRLTVVIMCRSALFYGLYTFLPLYWVLILHQANVVGNVVLTLLLAAGATGTLVGGRLADRYGYRIVVLVGFGSLVPLLLCFVTLSETYTVLALVLLIPIGLALFAPVSVMVVMGQEYEPNHVGTASGVTLGLAVSAGGVLAPLFGSLADRYGLPLVLFGFALLPALAHCFAWTLPEAHKAGSL